MAVGDWVSVFVSMALVRAFFHTSSLSTCSIFPPGRMNPSQYPKTCSGSCVGRATARYPERSVVRDNVTPILKAWSFRACSLAIAILGGGVIVLGVFVWLLGSSSVFVVDAVRTVGVSYLKLPRWWMLHDDGLCDRIDLFERING